MMNKFHFFLASAGLCIVAMAIVSGDFQSFAPGVILTVSVLINAVMTRSSRIITFLFIAIAFIPTLYFVILNTVHYGHMTEFGIKFLASAILILLFGTLPMSLRSHEYKQAGIKF